MKTARLLFVVLFQAARLFGQQYFFSDTFPGGNSLNPVWVWNSLCSGTTTPNYVTTTPNGLSSCPAGVAYPLVYTGQLPTNGRYEIKSTIASASSTPQARYVQFVAATNTGHSATD